MPGIFAAKAKNAGTSATQAGATLTGTTPENFERDLQDFLGWGTTRRAYDYQTEMANTAYQRAVADMKAAGLSPAMLYASGGQGASTPSAPGGSVKTGQAMDILGNVGNIMNSINNARMVDEATNQNEFLRSRAAGMYKAVNRILSSVR